MNNYDLEVKQRFGETDAYKEYAQKPANAAAADGAKSPPKNWSSSAIPTSKNSAESSTGRMKL